MRTAPRLLAGLLPLALAAVTLGGIRAPAAAYSIEPAHPRLYFTAADLPALRARTATTHAVQWQALLDWPQPDALAHAAYSGRDVARTHEYIERNAFMYLMTAVTSPVTAQAGGALGVTDTVRNQGSVGAGASSTRYYLSEDRARSADDLRLTGARSVAPLGPEGASSGTASLTVPLAAPAGPRYVLACADDLAAVTESSETNNCAATDAPITLGAPDLVVAAVSGPPASIKRGAKFLVTDTTRNQGNAATMRNTRTRYYLSANQAWSADDRLLTGYRVVPALAAGTGSTGSVNLTVPSQIVPGDYHVVVCADDLEVAPESNESNNCTATTARVTVAP